MPKLHNDEMTEIIEYGRKTEHLCSFAYKYWADREELEQSGQTHKDPVRYKIHKLYTKKSVKLYFSGIQLSSALQGIWNINENHLSISWRGTVHREHVFADLQSAPADASFAEYRDTFLSTLDDIIGSQDKLNITFYGHSLGGSIAQLSIDAVTTALLDDSKYPNISFDKIKTLTLSTANSPGVSQGVRGRFTDNSSKCKGHGLTLNAFLLRTQGDIIQHHCPQLASVGSWGMRELIIRPGVFKRKGKTPAGTAVSCSQKGFVEGVLAPKNNVDNVVNDVCNLANRIAVHKEQYLTDQLVNTPNTIIYTPHDTELVAENLEAKDYYNPQRLCGLILVTDSDHFNRHVDYDEIVSRETERIVEDVSEIFEEMIPDRNANQAEPSADANQAEPAADAIQAESAADANQAEPAADAIQAEPAAYANQAETGGQGRTWGQWWNDSVQAVQNAAKWAADNAKEVADAVTTIAGEQINKENHKKRREHFEKKIEKRCKERQVICKTFHQSCEKLYVSTAFRIWSEYYKIHKQKQSITNTIVDRMAITKHLTKLINNPPSSFLKYLGLSEASITWDGLSKSNSKLSEFKHSISDNSLLSSTFSVVTTQKLVTTRQKIRAILRQERDKVNKIRRTGWDDHNDEVSKEELRYLLHYLKDIKSKPPYATWQSVSRPTQAR